MKKLQWTLCCVVLCSWPGENSRHSLLPGNNMLSIIIPEFLGKSTRDPGTTAPDVFTTAVTESSILSLESDQVQSSSLEYTNSDSWPTINERPPPEHYPVKHAGVPRGLTVTPLPREQGDHELVLNVSWLPPLGTGATDYSLEVTSETETEDCKSPICYEYDIPGNSTWYVIPKQSISVPGTCAIKPGCAYAVRLTAHPWDGHTSANKMIKLDECVAGVCSCAYAPRLPAPVVAAQLLLDQHMVNISWLLPIPESPRRLPPNLQKQYYFVSIGKQMVSDAHPSPWFAYKSSRRIMVDGPVALGDDVRWTLMDINWRSDEQSVERRGDKPPDAFNVKLLARVNLVDERGCVGPAGNATAYDPAASRKIWIGSYFLWAALGGTCVLAIVLMLIVIVRAAKRILNALRPAPVSAPLVPQTRPAWFPLQLRG